MEAKELVLATTLTEISRNHAFENEATRSHATSPCESDELFTTIYI